ncbi:NUDIX hydrolase (plasmid) [Brucella pituitosa]|uniref:NUDIX hydrolase n=1 Tax=Brucella pituitosa TaxID=571256 RepID=UPI003C71F1FD
MKREIPIKSFAISLFILKPDNEGFKLLLLRRTGSTLTGAWCQIAGGIEDGETAWQAAIREAHEETGLVISDLYSADICEQFYEADRDAITLTPVFVAFVNSDSSVRLNNEHDAFRWVTFDEANLMLPFAGQRSTLEHIKNEFIDRKPNHWLRIYVENSRPQMSS